MAIVGRLLRAEARGRAANCNHLSDAWLAEEWARKVAAYERDRAEALEILGERGEEALRRRIVARVAAEVEGRIASGVYCRRCGGLHDANPSRYQIEERAARASSRRAR